MSQEEKIALFLPLNSAGHINSGIAIADCLRDVYKYRCVFAVIEQILVDGVKKHGHDLVEFEDVGHEDKSGAPNGGKVHHLEGLYTKIVVNNPDKDNLSPLTILKGMQKLFDENFVPRNMRNDFQYELLIKKLNPKIILVDNFFLPPYLLTDEGEKRCPWVRIASANPGMLLKSKLPNKEMPCPWQGMAWYTKEKREMIRREQPDEWKAMLSSWRSAMDAQTGVFSDKIKPVFDKYRELGLGNKPLVMEAEADRLTIPVVSSPYLNLYLCPEDLDYYKEDDLVYYPANFYRCNSLLREGSMDEAEKQRWLDMIEEKGKGKTEKVLFSLGSIVSGDSTLIKKCIEVFSKDEKRLYIVSKGSQGDQVELNPNNMIGSNWIPQTFLLQQVDLAIIHGGNNGITECLHYGVPMVVMPLFGDQYDNAQRVQDKNYGRRLDLTKFSGDKLMSHVNELLADQDIRKAVKNIGIKMRSTDALARAGELINTLAEKGHLDNLDREKFGITSGTIE